MAEDDFKTTIRRKLNEKKNNFLFICFQHELLKIKFCGSCAFKIGELFSSSHNYLKRFETEPSMNSKLLGVHRFICYHADFNPTAVYNGLTHSLTHTYQISFYILVCRFRSKFPQNKTKRKCREKSSSF